VQVVDRADQSRIKANNDVALSQTCSLCGAVFFHRYDQHPGFERQTVKSDDAAMQWHILTGDADVAAPNSAVPNQASDDKLGGVARDRKTDPLGGRIIAVLTPITSPAELTSGPPELPGFSAASV
jgi:hypothetical protein